MVSSFMRAVSICFLALMLLSLAACQAGEQPQQTHEDEQADATQDSARTPEENAQAEITLAPYDGTVEHLFFHPVVAYPELAFDGDAKAEGIDDWMVTVEEYNKILESLYQNDYILVDINSVWSEAVMETGEAKMIRNTLMLPEGKKPLILSFDDVNYYSYMKENGFTYKLILGKDGELWSWGLDPQGNEVVSQDLDAITILEKFVKKHPDFSWEGALGCIGLTGYEGILGYYTRTDRDNQTPAFELNRQKEIAAVQPIIAKLKENGWTFASHSWAHFSYDAKGLAAIQDDTQRWLDEVGSLVGPTQVLLYPFGGRPDGHDVNQTGACFGYLQSVGFRIFCSVGTSSFSKIKADISAVVCDRMHPDGTTLRWGRERYLPFYDAWEVIDLSVRPDRPYDRNP